MEMIGNTMHKVLDPGVSVMKQSNKNRFRPILKGILPHPEGNVLSERPLPGDSWLAFMVEDQMWYAGLQGSTIVPNTFPMVFLFLWFSIMYFALYLRTRTHGNSVGLEGTHLVRNHCSWREEQANAPAAPGIIITLNTFSSNTWHEDLVLSKNCKLGKMRLSVATSPRASLKALAVEVILQNTTVTEGAH